MKYRRKRSISEEDGHGSSDGATTTSDNFANHSTKLTRNIIKKKKYINEGNKIRESVKNMKKGG